MQRSSPFLTFKSNGTAISIIIVVRFTLTITTISLLRTDITMSVRFPTVTYYIYPVLLACIPVKNRGYIVVSFQVIAGSQILANIQYMGYGFIRFVAYAAY